MCRIFGRSGFTWIVRRQKGDLKSETVQKGKEKMDCWTFLGIEATGDEGEIRKAYLERLPGYHPEEDAEGFRQLREALEEALKEAKELREKQETRGKGILIQSEMMGREEIQDFLKQVETVYQDYGRRIQPEEWRKVLALPVCRELETQREAGWAFLGFLMDHFHLPHSCYQVFDQIFGWTEEEDELYNHFPEGFLDYLYDRIREEDSFRYDLFEIREGFDYDEFCELFFSLRTALGEKKREVVEELLGKLEAMGMEHPDVSLLRVRHEAMQRGNEKHAWELAKELFEKDGQNPRSCYWYVRTSLDYEDSGEDMEMLGELIKSLIEQEPEFAGYWQLMGDFLRRQGELSQALTCFRRARECSEDRWEYIEEQIVDTASELCDQLEKEPEFDDWWQLANICHLAERYERVRELLEDQEPDEEKRMSWLFMMAKSCHETEDYELAANYRQEIWDLFEGQERPLQMYVDLAQDKKMAGDTQRALEIYELAEEEYPGEPEIYYRRAEILSNEGLLAEAERLCDKALEIGFHRNAFNLRMEILLDNDRYKEVKDSAEQIFEQGYISAQIRYYYVRALRGLEEYDKAEEILKELVEHTGEIGVLCQEYAAVCSALNRPEEALSWIEKAIQDQDSSVRRYMKGQYLHDLERYEEEKAWYRMMMSQGLDNYYIHYRLAKVFQAQYEFDKAEEGFRKALERDSSYGLAWDSLGDVLQEQAKWEEAAEAYEQGWKNGNFQAIRDLCRLMKRTRQHERALEYLKQGLERQPNDSSLLLIQAKVLRAQKKYPEAVRSLGRYMEVKPSQTSLAYREIALCWERAKEYEKAEEYYQRAVDHEPKSARNWRSFGQYYADRKQYKEALPYLEKAVELEPESTFGWMKLGEVYEKLDRQEEAFPCYERSLENYQKEIESDPRSCCDLEGIADVLIHMGRLEEAEEIIKQVMSLQNGVFTCNAPMCYEGLEDMAKIEERRGNLEKALEWMEKAGEYSVTDYYPKEIARLKAAMGESDT